LAFLGIRINNEVGKLIKQLEVPGNKEDTSEYHITLLCFEKNWKLPEITKSIEVIYKNISNFKPFSVKASKVSHFPKREDHPMPIILPLESKELHKLRDGLAEAFNDAEIDFKKTFKEFRPHITLAYSEDGSNDFKMKEPIEFLVSELVLWCGDEIDERLVITFPLQLAKSKKAILQQADLFYKLAIIN
jgi:2'-5' RNA ligase